MGFEREKNWNSLWRYIERRKNSLFMKTYNIPSAIYILKPTKEDGTLSQRFFWSKRANHKWTGVIEARIIKFPLEIRTLRISLRFCKCIVDRLIRMSQCWIRIKYGASGFSLFICEKTHKPLNLILKFESKTGNIRNYKNFMQNKRSLWSLHIDSPFLFHFLSSFAQTHSIILGRLPMFP